MRALAGAAFLLSSTLLFPTPRVRTSAVLATSVALVLVSDTYGLLGAGAISNLVFGLLTRHLWHTCAPRFAHSAAHLAAHDADPNGTALRMLRSTLGAAYTLWSVCFGPLLFGLVGAVRFIYYFYLFFVRFVLIVSTLAAMMRPAAVGDDGRPARGPPGGRVRVRRVRRAGARHTRVRRPPRLFRLLRRREELHGPGVGVQSHHPSGAPLLPQTSSGLGRSVVSN